MALTAKQFQELHAGRQPVVEGVRVPEFDTPGETAAAFVRRLHSARRDDWECDSYQSNGKDMTANRRNVRARMVAYALCDADGQYLYAEADIPAAVGLLGELDSKGVDRIYETAARLNQLTAADEDDIEKKSVPGPSAASG